MIQGNVYSQKAGLWLGFLLALMVVSCGAFLIYSGRTGWGTGLISVPLISLVSVFVIGKRGQRRIRDIKPVEPAQSKLPFPTPQDYRKSSFAGKLTPPRPGRARHSQRNAPRSRNSQSNNSGTNRLITITSPGSSELKVEQ